MPGTGRVDCPIQEGKPDQNKQRLDTAVTLRNTDKSRHSLLQLVLPLDYFGEKPAFE